MGLRFSDLVIRRKLIERSAENPTTPVINGAHCREWQRASHNLGYGRMWDGTKPQYTHRLSHEVFLGPIPAGLSALHRCDNPKCLEPRHLWAGTKKENSEDMVSKGRHLAGRARGAAKTRGKPAPHIQGSKHPRAKLSDDQAREIKERLKRPKIMANRPTPMAREFNVSESLIRNIRDGRGWAWL